MIKVVILSLTILVTAEVRSQNIGEQVTLSSVIGDTLNPAERNRCGLFPAIRDFQWAVFYLYGDSTVNVRIGYRAKGGNDADSVIMNYSELRALHAQITTAGVPDPDSARILMTDGTLVSGVILGETATKLVVATRHLGQLTIPVKDAKSIVRMKVGQAGGYFSLFKDPNETRAFLMPTANTIPAGSGYVGDYELLFFTAAVGVTDWLMVNAGTLLIPVDLENEVIYYGFKARVYENHDKVAVALGLQMLSPLSENTSIGLGYGVVSFGNSDEKVNLAVGDAFATSGGSAFVVGISADARVSESIKLLAEAWIIQNSDVTPLVVGVRFFGSRLSGDLGLMYPIGADLGSPIGIPVANIVYNF